MSLHPTQAHELLPSHLLHALRLILPALPAPPSNLLQAHELLHTYYVPCGPEKYDITAPVVRSRVRGGG